MMKFVLSLMLFLAGMLGASGLILDRYPGTRNFIKALRNFDLLIGVVTLVLGIIELISLLDLGMPMFRWIYILIISIMMISLGLIEGYKAVQTMLSKAPKISDTAKELRDKLWNYKEVMGILAMLLAIVHLIFG